MNFDRFFIHVKNRILLRIFKSDEETNKRYNSMQDFFFFNFVSPKLEKFTRVAVRYKSSIKMVLKIVEISRTPVRQALSYGIRYIFIVIH